MKFDFMLPNKGRPYDDATWWIDEIFTSRGTSKQVQKRIAAGQPL